MRRSRHLLLPPLTAFLTLAACSGGSSRPDASPGDVPAQTDAFDTGDTVDLEAGPDADALADAQNDDVAVITGAARVRVTEYRYDLALATFRFVSDLDVSVTGPGDCLTLPIRFSRVDRAEIDGAPARDWRIASGRISACDPTGRGWAVGTRLRLVVAGTVPRTTLRSTQVGFSTRMDVEGRPFSYLLSWVGECDRFGPCDNDPAVFSRYRFTVHHDAATRVLCPGLVTAGSDTTTCVFDSVGGPTYSTFGVLAGQSWRSGVLGTTPGGVRVVLHDIPMANLRAVIQPDHVLGFLQWMSDTFGRYPYGDELRLVVAPTTWRGFEHPGNIALAESLAPDHVEHTIFHEITHQWAGDLATLASATDFVWKEAMAEYLAFVWESEHLPPAQARATASTWKAASQMLRFAPISPPTVALVDAFTSAYGPGPMVLFRQLEVLFSRDAVMRALRMLLGTERTISVDDVRRALETTTGANLEAYVNNWLRGSGAPVWPVVTVEPGVMPTDPYTIRVASSDGVARGCRFSVRFIGAPGEQQDVRVDLGVDGRMPAPLTVTPRFAVTRVEVDPDNEALVFPAMTSPMMTAPPPPAQPWLAP